MLLALTAALTFSNTLQNRFVWDDADQILRNPALRPERPWLPLFTSGVWSFTQPEEGARNNYYRPVQMATYKAIVQWFGYEAAPFHAANLLVHIAATLLAYAVFLRLLGQMLPALLGALLFAAHPIHTEAVAWISAANELGCAVFFLLAFYLYLLTSDKY